MNILLAAEIETEQKWTYFETAKYWEYLQSILTDTNLTETYKIIYIL